MLVFGLKGSSGAGGECHGIDLVYGLATAMFLLLPVLLVVGPALSSVRENCNESNSTGD